MSVSGIRPIGTMKMELLKPLFGDYPPEHFHTDDNIRNMLRAALMYEPSDIFINVGHPVILLINGKLKRLTNKLIEFSEFGNIARTLRNKEGATSILSTQKDYDGKFQLTDAKGVSRRMRVNMTATVALEYSESARIVLRPMQDVPPLPRDIGIGDDLLRHLYPQWGAVYVIGKTGVGKTTTFSSLVRHAAENPSTGYHGHWATYEAPVEYDLFSLSSAHLLITQTEIEEIWGLKTFADGIRNAMRVHPIAIMLGEVRDRDTIKAVVEAALTGHPVFGTVHADTPAIAFQRLLSRFDRGEQQAALYDLIKTTRVIVAQDLLDGVHRPRVAVREWVVFTKELVDQLLALEHIGDVIAAIDQAVKDQGTSFYDSAVALFSRGEITEGVLRKFMNR